MENIKCPDCQHMTWRLLDCPICKKKEVICWRDRCCKIHLEEGWRGCDYCDNFFKPGETAELCQNCNNEYVLVCGDCFRADVTCIHCGKKVSFVEEEND